MYYINKTTNYSFTEAEQKIREALKEKGFGILTEIDMQATMKNKLDKDIRAYKILGACNPNFAYQALQEEEKIGIMLPCNVTIIENENGSVDVSIMDPEVALKVVQNDAIEPFAKEVKQILEQALENI
jgi:uncharacterized protein (DUF302 family)